MFSILFAVVAFIGGVMIEKYLADFFQFGRANTLSFSLYLHAATIGLVQDAGVWVKALRA